MKKSARLKVILAAVIMIMLPTSFLVFTAGCCGPHTNETATPSVSTPLASNDDLERATVAEVKDGDTIVVDGGVTVQIIGVNSPEAENPGGREAAGFTRELLLGEKVSLEKDVVGTDRYERDLRHVWVGDFLASEEIIGNGYAAYKASPPGPAFEKYDGRLKEAETRAEKDGAGLWAQGLLHSQVKSRND